MPRRLLALALAATACLAAAPARAAEVPPGATWSEATIQVPDGTRLHADILRPKGLPDDARTPVILSIGPYFNHSGETGAIGGGYDPIGPSAGPSGRFHDLVVGGKLMERGYTFVMVDLRGFGGSSGCPDWGGPGEQADVEAAVEWAAAQKWSTGRVGMYGKSYDGVTGLMGAVSRPDGLAAVVAQEPVYDLYRYLYSNGVRYVNSVATPALYDLIAATPGPLLDSPFYNAGGATDPACLAVNYASQQDANHASEYWAQRDLIRRAKDATVPLFLTQGFLEDNTKPDGTWAFYDAVAGPKRAWFGMWDHVRGNDADGGGRLLMGRPGFLDEVMRFFDHHVRNVPLADAPTDRDPPVAVQTSDGSWRAERDWPPADTLSIPTGLRAGDYADDGENSGTGSGAGRGIWTISPPLPYDAHFAGVPTAELELGAGVPNANVVVNVYAIAPDREAILLSREASLVPPDGRVSLELYGNDWKLPAGYRLGVLVSGANAEWWMHVPTYSSVHLERGVIRLPFAQIERTQTIEGAPAVRLEEWLASAPFAIPEETIDEAATPAFGLPARLRPASTDPPPVAMAPPAERRRGKRLRVRIAIRGRRIVVYGNAPARARLRVALRRGKRTVAVRRLRTKVNAFRVTLRARRAGRYRVHVSGRKGKARLRAARAVRVR